MYMEMFQLLIQFSISGSASAVALPLLLMLGGLLEGSVLLTLLYELLPGRLSIYIIKS